VREHERSRHEIGGLGVRMQRCREQHHDREQAAHGATVARVLVALALVAALAACQHDTADKPSAFYNWDDRQVHCAINLDTYARNDIDSIKAGLDRALDRGEVIELYAHDPGRTVEWEKIEAVLAAITSRGLPYYTYADFVGGAEPGPGVALSFDDAYIDHWLTGSELYAQYGARLTFFIAYVDNLSPGQRAALHELAARGHAIEAHGIDHLRAPRYVEEHGLAAYIADEVAPSIELLRADGFDVTSFAYPYGARTAEIDRAVLEHVPLVRSVSFTWTSPATDPCPH